MTRFLLVSLTFVSIVSVCRLVVVLRHGYFTLPFGPIVTREEYPVRYVLGVVLLATVFVMSSGALVKAILRLGR